MAAAPPDSTGAKGITVEDCVVTAYLCALLREDSALGLDHHIVQRVGVQQRYAGYLLDDIVVDARRGTSSLTLSLEVKKKLDVSAAASNDDFRKIVHRAWQTIKSGTFQRGIDRVGAATVSISKAQSEALNKVCRWAKGDSDIDRFLKRFQPGFANDADRAVVKVIQELLQEIGVTEKEGVHELLRHFVLIEFDFGRDASGSELQAVSGLRSILVNSDEAPKLWATLRTLVRDGAGDAAEYKREGLLYTVNLDFRLKEHVLANAPVSMNLSVLRSESSPLGLSRVTLSTDLWGDYTSGVEPHSWIGRCAQVARSLPELREDIDQVEIVAPVGSKELSLSGLHSFLPLYLGFIEVTFQGDLHIQANTTVTLAAVKDRAVRDKAWERLVRARVPEEVFSADLPASILTISLSFGGIELRHVPPGRAFVLPTTVSYRLDVARADDKIAQMQLCGVKGLTLLVAADALRSYVEEPHDVELPIDLFGEPSTRTLRLRFRPIPADSHGLRLMGPFDKSLRGLILRWQRIQSAVDQEVKRQLMASGDRQ